MIKYNQEVILWKIKSLWNYGANGGKSKNRKMVLIKKGFDIMIVVTSWVDGFGNDTVVLGIFENIEKAKEKMQDFKDNDIRYQEIPLNEITYDIDYYEGLPLYK